MLRERLLYLPAPHVAQVPAAYQCASALTTLTQACQRGCISPRPLPRLLTPHQSLRRILSLAHSHLTRSRRPSTPRRMCTGQSRTRRSHTRLCLSTGLTLLTGRHSHNPLRSTQAHTCRCDGKQRACVCVWEGRGRGVRHAKAARVIQPPDTALARLRRSDTYHCAPVNRAWHEQANICVHKRSRGQRP